MTKTGKGSFLYSPNGYPPHTPNLTKDPAYQNKFLTESLGFCLIKMVYLDS